MGGARRILPTWTVARSASLKREVLGKRSRLSRHYALTKGAFMRCPECHGRVRDHSAGRDGMSPHFEHRENIPDALGVTISTERGAGIESQKNDPTTPPRSVAPLNGWSVVFVMLAECRGRGGAVRQPRVLEDPKNRTSRARPHGGAGGVCQAEGAAADPTCTKIALESSYLRAN